MIDGEAHDEPSATGADVPPGAGQKSVGRFAALMSPPPLCPLAGPAAASPPTLATLDYIVQCLEPLASSMPRADVVPLLPYLGWTVERVAKELKDVVEIVVPAEHASKCHALVDGLNQARQQAGLPNVSLTLTAAHAAGGPPAGQQQQQRADGGHAGEAHDKDSGQQHAQQHAEIPAHGHDTGSQVVGDWASPALRFEKVAVGGTFDRLHAGHRLLLAATAVVAKERIFVGITGGCSGLAASPRAVTHVALHSPTPAVLPPLPAADQLLASKSNRGLLQSYEEREAAAVHYMRVVNPGATVVAGPLTDPKVSCVGAATGLQVRGCRACCPADHACAAHSLFGTKPLRRPHTRCRHCSHWGLRAAGASLVRCGPRV